MEKRLERGEGVSHVNIGEESHSQREQEVQKSWGHLACLKITEEARVVEAE